MYYEGNWIDSNYSGPGILYTEFETMASMLDHNIGAKVLAKTIVEDRIFYMVEVNNLRLAYKLMETGFRQEWARRNKGLGAWTW